MLMINKKGVAPMIIVVILVIVVGVIWYSASSATESDGLGTSNPYNRFFNLLVGNPNPICGDGVCNSYSGETNDNCPSDCGGGFYNPADKCLGDDECPPTNPYCKRHVSAEIPKGYLACATCRDTAAAPDVDFNCKKDNPVCVEFLCRECDDDDNCGEGMKCTRDLSEPFYTCV